MRILQKNDHIRDATQMMPIFPTSEKWFVLHTQTG
jgi:hypothetical protein